MTDHDSPDADAGIDGTDPADRIGARVSDAVGRLFGEASPRSVFSEPVTVGDDIVITAAAWERFGGFGFGGGGGTGPQGEVGSGGGGGGGGSSTGRPVALVRIGPRGIEVKPIIDVTKVAVTVVLSALGVWRILRR